MPFGFPAALPIAWVDERFAPIGRMRLPWHAILGAAGFAAAWWASVGFLATRY